ncbi:MAG: serine/threonine protein kinase [Candidatus Methanomethylicia archaeon]|nr:serine/threonine protein kinase [Candidatus Methanomethylicia archaeon]
MLPIAAFKSLNKREFRILEIIESKMWDVLYVPLDYIILNSGFNRDFVVNSLKKMHDYGLVLFKRVPYESYMLTYAGYDVLALKFLVDSNYIIGVNGALGVGKESDVYMGFTPIEEAVVLKFHRLGAVNLHSASRTRGYLAESKNLPWIFRSKISAEREFKILMDVFKVGVSVPMPIVYDRHVVVMSYIEGDPLYVCDFLPDPMETFNMILDEIKLLYVNGGYVHGDLSEYNVIITPELKPIVIDWPQAIKVDDPSANMLLERDIYNIVTFFIKRFRLNLIFEEALSYVLGK